MRDADDDSSPNMFEPTKIDGNHLTTISAILSKHSSYVRTDGRRVIVVCPMAGTIDFAIEDEAGYREDPIRHVAAFFGVPRAAYVDWHLSNYRVLCSGTTKTGRQCRALALGGYGVEDPLRWLALHGSFCSTHADEDQKASWASRARAKPHDI